MRPLAIRWFEILLLAAAIIDLVNNLVGLQRVDRTGVAFLAAGTVPTLIALIFWYLIARRRLEPAKYVMAGLVAIGVTGFAYAIVRGGPAVETPMFVVALLTEAMKVAAAALLFRPEASAWLRR